MQNLRSPTIGITTYGRDEEGKFVLPSAYVDAVRAAGAAVLLVPPGETRWEPLLECVDGWILAGGGDLDPTHYDGAAHATVYMVDAERDRSELELARLLVERGVPTLGICRGTQLLNVIRGGSLHVHLPDVVGDEIAHRAPPREPIPHPVRVEAGSRLAALVDELEFDAHSWHHQAIDRVGDGLSVVARAPDGTIEAVEMQSHPWLVAVQWHPELGAATDPLQQRIFDGFVVAVRAFTRPQRDVAGAASSPREEG